MCFVRQLLRCLGGCCRKALFQAGGLAIWGKVLKGAARSSAFLALYCTLAWRGACFGFQATQRCTPPVIAFSAWTGEGHPFRHRPSTQDTWKSTPII